MKMRRRRVEERNTQSLHWLLRVWADAQPLLTGVWRDISAIGSTPCQALFFALLLAFQPVHAWEWLIAFILVHLIILLIRFAYYKPRPEAQGWKSMIGRLDAASFPSMHAARMGIIVMLSLIIGNTGLIILATGTAFLVMLSRVMLRKHDVLDVTLGFLLGMSMLWLVSRIV